VQSRPLLANTAASQESTWKPLSLLLSFQSMTQHNQKTNDLLLFELVDLLEKLAISKYEQKNQDDFDDFMNPKPNTTCIVDSSANL